jgi:hypothetical protein
LYWNHLKGCSQLDIPFIATAELGVLKAGNYKIVINNADANTVTDMPIKELQVAVASAPNVDHHIYPDVSHIELNPNNHREFKIISYNPSSCYEFDRAEVIFNKKETFSILPMMKQVSSFCPMKMTRFETSITLKEEHIAAPRVLLHVRSMLGHSLNKIVEIKP